MHPPGVSRSWWGWGAGSPLQDLISSPPRPAPDSGTWPCYLWAFGLGSSGPPLCVVRQKAPEELREVLIHVEA